MLNLFNLKLFQMELFEPCGKPGEKWTAVKIRS